MAASPVRDVASGGVVQPVTETITEVVAMTGVTHPNTGPYRDCSFVAVAWNEERRAPLLLEMAREWFTQSVVGVQESTDGTLSIVRSLMDRSGDQIVKHPHHGFGDASMPDLVARAKTPWIFVVAFDEMPDLELLQSIWSATAYADAVGADALWIPFESIVEGVEYTEQHGHLRLFRRRLGWPKTLHSRPQGKKELWWPYGRIRHERSLDEMMVDYIRYYELGRGNAGWERHNRQMMHDACVEVAKVKGWSFVEDHDWWPAVKRIAF